MIIGSIILVSHSAIRHATVTHRTKSVKETVKSARAHTLALTSHHEKGK